MPRTFQATVVLIATLFVLAVLTLINVVQTNQTEKQLLTLSRQVEKLATSNADIKSQLARGVAVSGQTGASTNPNFNGGDPYAQALQDPQNVLKAPTDRDLLYAPDDATEGGVMRAMLSDDPKGFNWLIENSVDVANLQALMHNTIARQDFRDPDSYVPSLAYKITVSPDYKEYTIHLRKGVMWHVPSHPKIDDAKHAWMKEQRELKAEDVKFLVDMIKNPQVEAGATRNYYEDLDRVEIVDDYTLKIFWKKKTYTSWTATLSLYPMPKWLFSKEEDGSAIPDATLGLRFNNHWASQYPIGTGPYRFVKYEKGVRLLLERFEGYWDTKPPIKTIDHAIIKSPDQSLLQLKADQLEYAALTPTQYNAEIIQGKNSPFTDGRIEHQVVDRFAYYYLGWNMDKPLFADKQVRRAMTMAFNRQGLIDNVFFKLGDIQSGSYYYKHPANDPTVVPWAFDLNAAAKLLDEAGWKDTDGDGIRDKVLKGEKQRFEFTVLAYGGSNEWRSALSVYKEDLRKIGVAMDFSPVDWPTMQKKMDDRQFDAVTGGWGLSWDIDPYQLFHSSQADEAKGSNRVGFRHERGDEILVTLRETFEPEERLKLLREFHRILHEEQPYTFFFAPKGVLSWQSRLKNVLVQKIRPQYYSLPWYMDGDAKE